MRKIIWLELPELHLYYRLRIITISGRLSAFARNRLPGILRGEPLAVRLPAAQTVLNALVIILVAFWATTMVLSYWSPAENQNPSAAKAWLSFDGTASSPITPNASYNIRSVTRNSTGNFTVSFSTPFSSTNYTVLCTAGTPGNFFGHIMDAPLGRTTSSYGFVTDGQDFSTPTNFKQNDCVFYSTN
jgi:hypothetical protein